MIQRSVNLFSTIWPKQYSLGPFFIVRYENFLFLEILRDVGDQVQTGALTAGGLIAFMLYVTMFFSPVQQLSQVFDSYQQAAVGLRPAGVSAGAPWAE